MKRRAFSNTPALAAPSRHLALTLVARQSIDLIGQHLGIACQILPIDMALGIPKAGAVRRLRAMQKRLAHLDYNADFRRATTTCEKVRIIILTVSIRVGFSCRVKAQTTNPAPATIRHSVPHSAIRQSIGRFGTVIARSLSLWAAFTR